MIEIFPPKNDEEKIALINGEALIKGQGVKNLSFITEKNSGGVFFFQSLHEKEWEKGGPISEINYTNGMPVYWAQFAK